MCWSGGEMKVFRKSDDFKFCRWSATQSRDCLFLNVQKEPNM